MTLDDCNNPVQYALENVREHSSDVKDVKVVWIRRSLSRIKDSLRPSERSKVS